MSQPITRISLDEFSRDAAGILKRLARTGERVEVAWDDRRVAIVPVDRNGAKEQRAMAVAGSDQAGKVTPPRIHLPTPDIVARRREVMQQVRAFQQELLAQRGGTPAPGNAELIRELREERARQLDER